ncbi:coenzyme F420-0:L-glutamate ligase [Kineosporia succinea]|uniref:Coenzyme F420-0:L-glutamate ligase/coenzyme F420-1:gamma-L-glutamate ligase n=1 Tax=Kineosporia succinea TaxID=84632 RepID=A0ABT9NY93_9ACTN|nr:coenzyme F420-0:L-glutamate ligase [Kineosporia succinea]MDP9825409.1 coenzyme F420-0:L-glutamate ligase/coenzyme F420-1:gamma-L-glutamate ligase [Kineosporia succinea]
MTHPSGRPTPGAPSLVVSPVPGIGEVSMGDDVVALVVSALRAGGRDLANGDVLVVSSKIVSKAEGRTVAAAVRDEQITAEAKRLVAARRTPGGLARIVESAAGPVMAAAGVDNSNVEPGTVLLLPVDPDGSARALRADLARQTGLNVGVIVSDTAGRAWRDGQTDFALGCAGVSPTEDLRGLDDTHGQRMEVTIRAVADELAAAGDLVKGKLTGIPVALVRGAGAFVLPVGEDGPGAAAMLRPAATDWFRYGQVEAVRWSMGVDPSAVDAPTVPAGPVLDRLLRVVEVALAAPSPLVGVAAPVCAVNVEPEGLFVVPELPGDPVALGALAQRLAAAAWSEDLAVTIRLEPRGLRVLPALTG